MTTDCVKLRIRRIAETTNVPNTPVSNITFGKTEQDGVLLHDAVSS